MVFFGPQPMYEDSVFSLDRFPSLLVISSSYVISKFLRFVSFIFALIHACCC